MKKLDVSALLRLAIALPLFFRPDAASAAEPQRDKYISALVGFTMPEDEFVEEEKGHSLSALYGFALNRRFSRVPLA